MIKDALDGRLDLIVTKSVSRFARNTVDSLTTIRKLKEKGVECYFEKENIWTLDSKGELLITIMSSLAQEESRSISENVTWGLRRRFENGKCVIPYGSFLGFEKGDDGTPQIVEKEAQIVRLIYCLFMDGKTPAMICRELENRDIKSPRNKDTWSASTVFSILTNEKYKGSAILQKTYVADYLTKKKKVNNGELPKYIVEDSHQYIIEPAEWDLVQEEVARRRSLGKGYSGSSYLSSKLVCEDCGSFFGSKVWHSNDKYKCIIYRCNKKYESGLQCRTPHIKESEVKDKFLQAYNLYIGNFREHF